MTLSVEEAISDPDSVPTNSHITVVLLKPVVKSLNRYNFQLLIWKEDYQE